MRAEAPPLIQSKSLNFPADSHGNKRLRTTEPPPLIQSRRNNLIEFNVSTLMSDVIKSGSSFVTFDQGRKMAEVSQQNYYSQSDGSSIRVEYVQALTEALNRQHEIPPRYVRPEAETEPVAGRGGKEIPIVDLGSLIDPQSSEAESRKLMFACEEWGFFQLINHGVPKEVMNQMKADMIEFFKLSHEEKKAYAQLPNSLEGYGQAFVASEDQKLDWADMFYLVTRPVATRKMKLWPSTPPTFKDTLDKYSSELKKLAGILLNLIANDLGLDPEVLLNIFNDQPQGLRMNYYPPCPKADKVLGISPHTDAVGFTLLLEVNDVQGLQIRKEGKWVPVEPMVDAFVVNIGDALEILSNGKYRSIEHRVMINTERERLSVAAFHGPDGGCMLGPLPELVRGGKENYRTISYAEYMKTFLSEKLNGRSLLESMRLE